jgi:trehalose-6-phosphate synthase
MEARRIQHELLKTHKKQIHGKNKERNSLGLIQQEEDDHEFLRTCRQEKITFEKDKHTYKKKIQEEKIVLDKEKVSIEKARLQMDKAKSELMENKIKGETLPNDKKIMLLKLEMIKQ